MKLMQFYQILKSKRNMIILDNKSKEEADHHFSDPGFLNLRNRNRLNKIWLKISIGNLD